MINSIIAPETCLPSLSAENKLTPIFVMTCQDRIPRTATGIVVTQKSSS